MSCGCPGCSGADLSDYIKGFQLAYRAGFLIGKMWAMQAYREEVNHMMLGQAVFCENDECSVLMFSVSVDDWAARQSNCPGCGQFGRTKGGQHYPPTSIAPRVPGYEDTENVKGEGFVDGEVTVGDDGIARRKKGRPVRDNPQA